MTNEQLEYECQNEEYWWESEGVRFECRQCGGCCCGEPGTIWVTPGEIKEISEFLCVSELELRAKYLTRNGGRNSIKERENYDCVFLARKKMLCEIYKVRPLQCSLFPFWPTLLKDRSLWNYYARRCPGMNQGKLYTAETIKRLQNVNIWQDL